MTCIAYEFFLNKAVFLIKSYLRYAMREVIRTSSTKEGMWTAGTSPYADIIIEVSHSFRPCCCLAPYGARDGYPLALSTKSSTRGSRADFASQSP